MRASSLECGGGEMLGSLSMSKLELGSMIRWYLTRDPLYPERIEVQLTRITLMENRILVLLEYVEKCGV